jgi:hypothetical protein
MEKCDDPMNPKAMREVLRKDVKFNSFYGTFGPDEDGIQVGHKIALIQWQNGYKKCVWPPEGKNAEMWYPMPKWSER